MNEKNAEMTTHLQELRKVLIISLLSILAGAMISYFFFLDRLMDILTAPLNNMGEELIFLGVTEGFIAQLKVALFGGLIIGCPIIIWQILSFILPALYSHEKKIFWPIFFFGIVLFIFGIFFGYKFVLELGLRMLLINFSGGLTPMISVSKYISFVTSFLLPFGVVFEIPLLSFFLTKIGLITPVFLRTKRKIVIIIIFVIAAVLTPADIMSQMFLAVPMLILYEIGIIVSTLAYRKEKKKKEEMYD